MEKHRPNLQQYEDIYRHLHSSPELSGQEEQTAALAASHLTKLGYKVHAHIGGHGVAGVLHNGPGPTILLRADMDALPVEEKTNLSYASKKVTTDKDGVKKPLMHACGHDFHTTSLMAAAQVLYSVRENWSGTLICLFQPSEEYLNGAKAMIDDGLYNKIPKPDLVLAQHVLRMREGTVSIRSGPLLTAADSFDVRVFGRGGHGSAPHTCIDPIIIGSSIVTRLQGIVSREVAPGQLAVVTVGSIQAGHTANIIPDYLDLKINIRTYNPSIRDIVIKAITRIIETECKASGATEKPSIKCVVSSPATINDDQTVKTLRSSFGSYFQDRLVETEPATASEDFSLLATAVGAPYVMWTYGGMDGKTWDEAVETNTVNQLPGNHSPFFAPVIQPTLQTGVDAMTVGALTFLGQKQRTNKL
ncbi:hypothetical protein MW887_006156 [Aspergillus wentii]|nr:hypothetical protein MW887_006156 [Aspergillus wentii]